MTCGVCRFLSTFVNFEKLKPVHGASEDFCMVVGIMMQVSCPCIIQGPITLANESRHPNGSHRPQQKSVGPNSSIKAPVTAGRWSNPMCNNTISPLLCRGLSFLLFGFGFCFCWMIPSRILTLAGSESRVNSTPASPHTLNLFYS